MKPVERREAADAEHQQVALLARGQRDLLEACGALSRLLRRPALEQQGAQAVTAVRSNKS